MQHAAVFLFFMCKSYYFFAVSKKIINFETNKVNYIKIKMKKKLFFCAFVLCLTMTACTGSSDNASKRAIPAPSHATTSDTSSTQASPTANSITASPTAPSLPQVGTTSLPKPKKPESSTDKLLKQYSETFVNYVLDTKAGKAVDDKQLLELKDQLEKLEKSGGLTDDQKELFKATNDAYNQFKNK